MECRAADDNVWRGCASPAEVVGYRTAVSGGRGSAAVGNTGRGAAEPLCSRRCGGPSLFAQAVHSALICVEQSQVCAPLRVCVIELLWSCIP